MAKQVSLGIGRKIRSGYGEAYSFREMYPLLSTPTKRNIDAISERYGVKWTNGIIYSVEQTYTYAHVTHAKSPAKNFVLMGRLGNKPIMYDRRETGSAGSGTTSIHSEKTSITITDALRQGVTQRNFIRYLRLDENKSSLIDKILKEGFMDVFRKKTVTPAEDNYEQEKIRLNNSLNKRYPGQFSHAGLDDENETIANCNFCGANGVLVREHINSCKAKQRMNESYYAVDPSIDINRTSLVGYIDVSYQEIVNKLGEPESNEKSMAEWKIMGEPDSDFPNVIATLYDYSAGMGLNVTQITEWHIGGKNLQARELVSSIFGKRTKSQAESFSGSE